MSVSLSFRVSVANLYLLPFLGSVDLLIYASPCPSVCPAVVYTPGYMHWCLLYCGVWPSLVFVVSLGIF